MPVTRDSEKRRVGSDCWCMRGFSGAQFPQQPGVQERQRSLRNEDVQNKIEARTFKKGKEYSLLREQGALSQEGNVCRDTLITPWQFLSQRL